MQSLTSPPYVLVAQAPAILIPLGQSSDSPHLANERIRRQNLVKGKVGATILGVVHVQAC